LSDAWDVYLKQKNKMPKLTRKKFYAFSTIARREEHNYKIYEIDEIYADEQRKDEDRFIVKDSIVNRGYYHFSRLYNLHESQQEYPLYYPEDIMEFVSGNMVPEAMAFKRFLEELRSTSMYIIEGNERYRNENRNLKLKDCSFSDRVDRYILEGIRQKYEKNPGRYQKEYDELIEEENLKCSEKLFRFCEEHTMIGDFETTKLLQYFSNKLELYGVEVSEKRLQKLMELFMNFHNHAHRWCQNGWTPYDLGHKMHQNRKGPVEIVFGPNMEKMIQNGEYSREELIRMIEGRGMKVADSSKYGRS